MYKHILVAVSTSLSESALTTAISRARDCNARLTALHVVDQTPWWAVVTAECNFAETAAVIDDHARAVTRYSARMIERAGIDGVARSITLPPHGVSIGEAIADVASEIGADLIVLGGEAETGWRFGEARMRDVICTHTACDVLIASHGVGHVFDTGEMQAIEARFTQAHSAPRNNAAS
ncbi:universal stress protein [Caballeronia sp. GACF4]|uniref:universal stress protein n=1 Tax=Caballeronia sp. GACF4 TaxID=2921763 RepID=UPI002027EC5F|nr:universal stress protein [Caballeronia sp. GACF4]